jgi:AraC family transcriptional regulator
MGITFARFALRSRLAGAAQELVSGDDALKNLAGRWGFTDASHFHHAFARHYGCTPGEYRARRDAASIEESAAIR